MKSFYQNFMSISGLKNISAAIGFIFSLTLIINAAPPGNDNFLSAQTISGVSGQGAVFSNAEATKESGEPNHGLNRGGRSVWYKYTATGNGVLILTTANSIFNTTMAVYEGSSLSNLQLVAQNNDTIEGGSWNARSKVTIGTKSGTTYYIAIDGNYDYETGAISTGNVILNFSFVNSATNDNFADAISIQNLSRGSIVTTNVGASKESGEPNHANNQGGKSVWFKWSTIASNQKNMTFTLDLKNVEGQGGVNTQFAIYTGTNVNNLTNVTARAVSLYEVGKLTISVTPNTTYYIVIDGWDNGNGAANGTFTLSFAPTNPTKQADFDRDGKADLTVYRPSTGVWYSLNSVDNNFRAYQFGLNGDKPLIVDFDRDGKHDYTVFRPDTGVWYSYQTYFSYKILNWGTSGDRPLIYKQHYFGTDFNYYTVFRPSTGTWWFSSGFGSHQEQIYWGQNGDIPVLADFTGDGTDNFTVFRPSTGTWYILLNNFTYQFQQIQFGQNGDKPVVADYDGDGIADIAIYRPSTGTWWFRDSQTGAQTAKQFGIASDIPQPADYDGDSKADPAVYRNGVWWILQSSNGAAKAVSFGLNTDIPISSPIN